MGSPSQSYSLCVQNVEREPLTLGCSRSSPTIVLYLTIALCLLFPPLLMSDELKLAYQSGHFGFFTEAGFWLQELVMAWCGLASLASFWSLIKVRLAVPAMQSNILTPP